MAQERIEDTVDENAALSPDRKLRFIGTVELGGQVSDQMLGVLFNANSNVDGTLVFDGALQIDGHFRGSIKTNDVLVIGPEAEIAANVTCGSAIVSGRVTGNITAGEAVELRPTAMVKGDISARVIGVDRGAVFEGTSRMGTLPSASKRKPGR